MCSSDLPAQVSSGSVTIRTAGNTVLTANAPAVAHRGVVGGAADSDSNFSIDWQNPLTSLTHSQIDEGQCRSFEVLATTATSAQDQSLNASFNSWGLSTITPPAGSVTGVAFQGGAPASILGSYRSGTGTGTTDQQAILATGTPIVAGVVVSQNVNPWLDQTGAYSSLI